MGRKSKISRNQKSHSQGVDYEISYDASKFWTPYRKSDSHFGRSLSGSV
jgi:hypothetical protein